MKVITFGNRKGGVGKTTAAVNVADRLARRFRVLFIDCDPQGNGTYTLKFRVKAPKRYAITISEILSDPAHYNIEHAIIPSIVDNLDLIPCDYRLDDENHRLVQKRKRDIILKKQLAKLKDKYDYVIIDCPPSNTVAVENALVASDLMVIVIDQSDYAQTGIANMIGDMTDILGGEIDIPYKVIANKVDKRSSTFKEVIKSLSEQLPNIFEPSCCIRVSENVSKSVSSNQTLHQYKSGALINVDFQRLTEGVRSW